MRVITVRNKNPVIIIDDRGIYRYAETGNTLASQTGAYIRDEISRNMAGEPTEAARALGIIGGSWPYRLAQEPK